MLKKNLKISNIFKLPKLRDSSVVAHSLLRILIFSDCFIFKNERVKAIPANPYFLPKMADNDVTLTSQTADLS